MSDRAEQAWHELRGSEQVPSLAFLAKHRTPLVTVRCTADRELVGGVWRTSAGPLLVTGHGVDPRSSGAQPVAGTGVFRFDTPGQGFNQGVFAGSRPWTPQLALVTESLDEALPLRCPRCKRTVAITPARLAQEVVAALSSAQRRIAA